MFIYLETLILIMDTGVNVCDAMTHQPITVRGSVTLAECAILMRNKKVGSVLVKDNSSLLGIVTERDIVRRAVAAQKIPGEMTVADVMSTDIKSISPEKDIFEAINLMRDCDFRHLPVIDGKKLIGLLTVKDILKIEPQLFDLLVEKIELREEERKMRLWAHEEESKNQGEG